MPVLSRQITSTEASDSTAFSCWASAPRRAIAQRGDGEGHARQQDQPLRDERHDRGDRRRRPPRAIGVSRSPERVAERDAERDHDADEDQQQPVERPLERRARVAELARLAGQPRGVAVLADRGHVVGAGALDRERAGAHLVAGARATPARDSPVRIDSSTRERRRSARAVPSATTWSPASSADEIADDDLLDAHLARLAVADDASRSARRARRAGRARCLRAHLLRDPDPRVGDEDREEERVLRLAEREREHAERRAGSG